MLFLEELMLCDRDDRQGFPPEVATEIFSICLVHMAHWGWRHKKMIRAGLGLKTFASI